VHVSYAEERSGRRERGRDEKRRAAARAVQTKVQAGLLTAIGAATMPREGSVERFLLAKDIECIVDTLTRLHSQYGLTWLRRIGERGLLDRFRQEADYVERIWAADGGAVHYSYRLTDMYQPEPIRGVLVAGAIELGRVYGRAARLK
jgi:hypothetical protein